MLEVFDTYIRPLVEFATPLWNTGYIADSRKLESVQRKWTAQITGFENLPYNERLERFDLYSLKGRRTRYDLIKVWKILHSKSPIWGGIYRLTSFFKRPVILIQEDIP